MPTKSWIATAGLLLAASLAWVRYEQAHDPYSASSLEALFLRPHDPRRPGDDRSDRPPFWETLLEEPFAERSPSGITLRLGHVIADPSMARRAADQAGELLALEAEGPDGPLGVPLWRAICDRAVEETHTEEGLERTLSLYGCRHTANIEAGPLLEDTYAARLSLARALREHGRNEPDAAPFTLRGEDSPVRGGINFEVTLAGETQSIEVTFDGSDLTPLCASRPLVLASRKDAAARAQVVATLMDLTASRGEGAPLTIEGREEPVPGGTDLRLEIYEGRLAVTAHRAGSRLSTYRSLGDEPQDSVQPPQ